MFEQIQQDERRDVALTSTEATAQVVQTMLAAHGIQAATVAYSRAFPSVDWVTGFRVWVRPEDEAQARALLAPLRDRDDVADPPAS
ncbi:MAG: hypothetical protein R3343_03720 [Nitriliruptorales bacterium]|nr:hypothetical protein [Nitriliruptorales bacterium]